jgi:hypothetical protein
MPRLTRSLLLFVLAAALLAVAGCDSGTPPSEVDNNSAATVSFAVATLSALEEDSPIVELPVQINNPQGEQVTVEVLFARASSSESFDLADLGITDIDADRAFFDENGELAAYVIGSVTFPPSAEDGDVRVVETNIADEAVEDQEVGVFTLQNVTGGDDVGYGELRDLELTISAEGTITLVSEDFADADGAGELGVFTQFSVASGATWETGTGGDAPNIPYAVANGFGSDEPSNDWLISPALDFDSTEDEVLSFLNAKGFDDGGLDRGLQVLVSTDYDGESNPENFEWTNISDRVTFSEGDFEFVSSGDIDLSDDAFQSDETYIAFQYLSSGTGPGTSESWEVDNVVVSGRETGE